MKLSWRNTWKIVFLSGLTMVALAAVNYISFYPVYVTADEPEVFGAPFLASSGQSVALVVDTAEIRQAGSSGRFSQTDWSFGWMNLLLQESRRYDIVDMSELQAQEKPGAHRIWIFTRSAMRGHFAGKLSAILDTISQWGSQSGGDNRAIGTEEPVIYLEAPDTLSAASETVSSLLGNKVTPRTFTRLTRIQRASHFGMPTVSEFKLSCDGIVSTVAPPQSQVLLEFDSSAVLYETHRNSLRVLLATFDFGQLAVTIQQGRPNEDFSVRPHITKRTGLQPLVSSDLCADSSYYKTFTPFFDLFEHALFSLISGADSVRPLFPESSHGAFVMSHDEEGMGDKASWMAEQEQRWGVTSATLVTPAAITSRGLKTIVSSGGEVGLHVDQYSFFKHPGLPGLRPLRVENSIAEQKRILEGRLWDSSRTFTDITINRNHWLLWSQNYIGMFRKLAAAGIRLDLTYGPIGKDVAGYLFGTCFPFVPLDTNGFPLPILELPFLFQEDEDFAAGYLDSIFDTSAFHQEIVNVVFHTNTMGHSPDTLLMWGWRESFIRAKNAKLPIVQYNDILEALRTQRVTLPPGLPGAD